MYDVSRGNLRVRGWPKKRKVKPGSITAEHNEWFRQAQWATKYWPEPMVRIIAEAREASPILPRDIMTMVMSGRAFYWTNTDGLTVYPIVARNDVSDSLDVISQFPGSILARGTDYWQPITGGAIGQVLTATGPDTPPVWAAGGGSSSELSLIFSWDWTSNVPHVDIPNLEIYSEIVFDCRGIGLAASQQRYIHVSVDGGATFYSTSGDYLAINANGEEANTSAFFVQAQVTASPRTVWGQILNNKANGQSKMGYNPTNASLARRFVASTDPITTARLVAHAGAQITSGSIRVYGR